MRTKMGKEMWTRTKEERELWIEGGVETAVRRAKRAQGCLKLLSLDTEEKMNEERR